MSKKSCNDKIDFVICWVDGNDPKWRAERDKYIKNSNRKVDNRENRYRDWENLQYLFRGIEKFAPWVNNVFFITCGHLPKWLNTDNPKLKIVKHEDYIPKEYLPTFNSTTIELSMHKIKDLSENFVYFNDDMFLTRSVKKEDFFKNGRPCDCAILEPLIPDGKEDFVKAVQNDMQIINANFNKSDSIRQNFFKWFNLKYGKYLLMTFSLMPWKDFAGFYEPHLSMAFKKSTFEEIWSKEYEVLDNTSKLKFRMYSDAVGIWLMRYWQIAKGDFYPRSPKIGKLFEYENVNDKKYDAIRKQKYKIVCVNDGEGNYNFEEEKRKTIDAFEKILPDKCSFEKKEIK